MAEAPTSPQLSPRRKNEASPTSSSSPTIEAGAAPPAAAPLASPRRSPAAPTTEANEEKQLQSPPGSPRGVSKALEGNCVHCGNPMWNRLGSSSPQGPLHNECVVPFRRRNQERCGHCFRPLGNKRVVLTQGEVSLKAHPECTEDIKARRAYVPPRREGLLKKFSVGRSKSSLFPKKNWKERYFVLSPEFGGFAYFDSQAAWMSKKEPEGVVRLDRSKCRLISRPEKKHHPEVSNMSKDFLIVFFEGDQELRLLCSANSWEEQQAWCDAIAGYLTMVDDVRDEVTMT